MKLRPARPEEAGALSALCVRSKAWWGYDATFMALCRESLTVTARMIAAGDVLVAADAEDRPLGVGALGPLDAKGEAELALLFVDPAAMGLGVGRALFHALCGLARSRGARRLGILADPGAAPFYRRLGAIADGEAPSDTIPGRTLPRFYFDFV